MIVQKNFIVKEETFERELFGNFDENIKLIEDTLKIDVILREGNIVLMGEEKNVNQALKLMTELHQSVSNGKNLEKAAEELALISGQKPLITKAKKSIAGFRLREGVAIGAKVTLRGERMYEFLDKLVTVSLPRVRDFHGVPTKSFDGRGNYTLGVKEQLIFPEINFDDVDKTRGLDIVIVTTANTDEESRALLTGLGMPFAK